MKTYNSDKSIRPTSKSDNLKNIINSNINEKNFNQNSANNSSSNSQFVDQLDHQSEYLISQDDLNDYQGASQEQNTESKEIDVSIELENDYSLNTDNLIENPSISSNIKSKKQKISIKKIFLNSEFYTFCKVWLNLNRWGVFLYLIFAASTVVFFVYNVRKVNMLLAEIRLLNKTKIELQGKNKILEVKLVELQSPERINKIAIEQLGFIKAIEAPYYVKRSN